MSRRPNPAADKAAANQAVIKNLLKLSANRVCADCKRNKLPRWASWNLGIFICIRCSGIHRGMGTHISKVKSVDLDSWTDEQVQSVVKWGNTRANKYWEANLAPGHVPSEAKIENFIRTKYESKRWVMEGGMPDPSTLEDSDDDNVPLKQVQEKLERKSSAATAPLARPQQQQQQLPLDTLIDDQPAGTMPKSPPKPKQPDSSSLLGLDIFGTAPAPSPRPSSVNSDPGKVTSSRPDLNRSILSLYASSPKPPQPRVQSPTMGTFGSSLQSSMMPPPQQQQQQQSAFGDLNDSFSGLNFNATNAPPAAPPKPSPFANLTVGMKKTTAAAPQLSKPAPGGFFTPAPAKPSPVSASSGLEGLFDFGAPAAPPAQAYQPPVSSNNGFNSLSFDADAWVTPAATTSTAANNSNAWGTPILSSASSAHAWGSPAPVSKPPVQPSYVNNDDDWGNFSSGTSTTAPVVPVKVTPGASGLDEDLFGNVWK